MSMAVVRLTFESFASNKIRIISGKFSEPSPLKKLDRRQRRKKPKTEAEIRWKSPNNFRKAAMDVSGSRRSSQSETTTGSQTESIFSSLSFDVVSIRDRKAVRNLPIRRLGTWENSFRINCGERSRRGSANRKRS
jgi:hypothetical protein